MKILRYLIITSMGLVALSTAQAATTDTATPLKISVVNFKTCVEQSKIGKEEQSSFEALRKQMENALADKEKIMNDYANKLNDADYLDSLSPEAETDLKRKSRALNQELQQIQGQFYQTLNQANMKIVQNLQEAVSKSSKTVAEKKNIDLIVNEETVFFVNPKYDISSDVIAEMDNQYDNEQESKKS